MAIHGGVRIPDLCVFLTATAGAGRREVKTTVLRPASPGIELPLAGVLEL